LRKHIIIVAALAACLITAVLPRPGESAQPKALARVNGVDLYEGQFREAMNEIFPHLTR
jgi:hypothetical protein